MNWRIADSAHSVRLALAVLFNLSLASSAIAGETLVGRVPIWWEGKIFELDVTETGAPFERRLTIICTTGCARAEIFTNWSGACRWR